MGASPASLDPVLAQERGRFTVQRADDHEVVLRVSNSTDVKMLASSISFALQDSRRVTMRAIGAGAINQMVKATAIARGYVALRAVDLVVRPGFTIVMMPSRSDPKVMEETTAMVFILATQ